jgi:integrase
VSFVLIGAAWHMRTGKRGGQWPMRRTGHIRERAPGSFELRYSLGTDPATGKRKIATATVRGSRKDAEKELRRLLRTLDTNEHVDPSRLTVKQWLASWLEVVREEVAPRTHERYAEIVKNFLVPALGNLPIAKLAPTHLQNAYTGWATGGRRDKKAGGLSPQTRRHIHRILSTALTRAVEQQVIARNPCNAFKKKRLPKVERQEMATLTAEQSASLLEAIQHTQVYWPVLIALSTGMRRGEVLALRWKNVGDNGVVRVVESLEQTKGGLRFKLHKGDKVRTVILPDFVLEELRRLKREQAESLLAIGVRQTGETLLCGRADGKPKQPRSLTHEFSVLMARIPELPRVRFHDLRHSHATQLLAAGVHPKIAQERLGHSTISITMDLYSHVTETMQEDAAARLDAAFKNAKMRRPK